MLNSCSGAFDQINFPSCCENSERLGDYPQLNRPCDETVYIKS